MIGTTAANKGLKLKGMCNRTFYCYYIIRPGGGGGGMYFNMIQRQFVLHVDLRILGLQTISEHTAFQPGTSLRLAPQQNMYVHTYHCCLLEQECAW